MEPIDLFFNGRGGIFMSHFGERLKEARKGLGLSQAEAADLVKVTREHWGRCERGLTMPGGEMLAGLAAAGIDVNYILTGARPYPTQHQSQHAGLMAADPGAAYGLKPEERALLDNYRAAAPEGQKALRDTSAALAKSTGCVKKSG